jgi:hypothetical protein
MENLPFHIKEISKLYPIVTSFEGNLAEGIIQNWDTIFIQNKVSLPRPGAYVSIRSKYTLPCPGSPIYSDYGEVWTHLGNGYFKQVIKKKIGL